jgi:hypothetical protein
MATLLEEQIGSVQYRSTKTSLWTRQTCLLGRNIEAGRASPALSRFLYGIISVHKRSSIMMFTRTGHSGGFTIDTKITRTLSPQSSIWRNLNLEQPTKCFSSTPPQKLESLRFTRRSQSPPDSNDVQDIGNLSLARHKNIDRGRVLQRCHRCPTTAYVVSTCLFDLHVRVHPFVLFLAPFTASKGADVQHPAVEAVQGSA